MLPTESVGWNGLQVLKSRLSGRLAMFERNMLDDRRPQKAQNDAAFFETDLRYVFMTAYEIHDLSVSEYHEMHQKALDLLTSLESMVNEDLIEETTPHDIAMPGVDFPHMSALLRFIDTSVNQFNLINGPGTTLFVLPQGKPGSLAIERLSRWRNFLARFLTGTRNFQDSRFLTFNRGGASPEVEIDSNPNQHHNNASAVINALFREFKQRSCEEVHEIKLKIPDECQSNERQSALDMFVSYGPDGDLWQETQCGRFQVAVARRRSICSAIQQAMAQNRKLYLFFYKEELLDVSDQLPPKASSSDNLIVQSLDQLLDQKMFTKITPRDYLEGTISAKVSSREKIVLALRLARCLMDLFNGEADLTSSSWKPESIDFIRYSGTNSNDRRLYIRLKPSITNAKPADVLKTVGPGNPILLSFAKLLLEIDSGEKIPMDIHFDNRENVVKWGEMCGFVHVASMEGNGDYIKAVEGCLYLHMALPKSTREEKASRPSSEVVKRAIYEQIVKNLELMLYPETSKRRRRDSVSDLLPSSPTDSTPKRMMFRHQHPSSRALNFSRPKFRHGFRVAIVCALQLEFDAVSLLFDEFWDENCDCYGRADGDPNIYTTGRIGNLNVVLVLLSNMGKVSAASASASLRSSYSGLSFVLVSGVCGGVPFPAEDEELVLGDVVISKSVVQYDLGRKYPNEFMMSDRAEDHLGRAHKSVRNLLAIIETHRAREQLEKMASLNLQQIQQRAAQRPRGARYRYPGAREDRLFQSEYIHKHRRSFQCLCTESQGTDVSTCQASWKLMCEDLGCDISNLVQRRRLELKQELEDDDRFMEAQAPSIFVGRIASGDTVLKSGEERDKIVKRHGVIAFEMEGAGVWDEFPCIIVKAACDYADSHKNKLWQEFAAATAASVTKALLERYIQREVPLGAAVQ